MRNLGLWRGIFALLTVVGFGALLSAPARAQDDAAQSQAAYQARADEVVVMLNGGGDLTAMFAPSFLTAVPETQLRGIATEVTRLYGPAQSARILSMNGPRDGRIEVRFAHGVGDIDMVLEPVSPDRIIGLLLIGFRQEGDDFPAITTAFDALPGHAGFAVVELSPDGPRAVAEHRADDSFAIGSTFKLYILAELAAQTRAGQRGWGDVAPLTMRSLPSGILQGWPMGAPMTLHSLAALMVSISDNTAADVLLMTLGRDAVDRRVALSGHVRPSDIVPMLGTREAFTMKMPAADGFRQQFVAHGDVGQARLLNANQPMLQNAPIDAALLANAPLHIDSVEWFATPRDLVRLMAHIRDIGSVEAMDIMAINKGAGPADAARWRYLGYKGGSETGVINMTFLGERPDGRWFVVTGSWNNTAAAVDEAQFAVLMTRLLNLAAAN